MDPVVGDTTQRSGRYDVRPVPGKLRDDRGIEVQRFGDHIWRTMRQPIGQRDLLEPVRPEDLHVNEIRVTRVLDVMAQRFLHVADVTRMKVCGDRRRPGVEGGHARGALENIRPFIGIRMPVHVSQPSRLYRNPCCCNSLRHKEIAAIGNLDRPALRLHARRHIGEAEHEGSNERGRDRPGGSGYGGCSSLLRELSARQSC